MLTENQAAAITRLWAAELHNRELIDSQLAYNPQAEKNQPFVLLRDDLLSVVKSLADLRSHKARPVLLHSTNSLPFNEYLQQLTTERKAASEANQQKPAFEVALGWPVCTFSIKGEQKIASLLNFPLDGLEFKADHSLQLDFSLTTDQLINFSVAEYLWTKGFKLPQLKRYSAAGKSTTAWQTSVFTVLYGTTTNPHGVLPSELTKKLTALKLAPGFSLKNSAMIFVTSSTKPTVSLRNDLEKMASKRFWQNLPAHNPARQYMLSTSPPKNSPRSNKLDDLAQTNQAQQLSASQAKVLNLLLNQPLTTVLGPPGTGKTRLLKFVATQAFCQRCYEMASSEDWPLPAQALVVIASMNNLAVDHATALGLKGGLPPSFAIRLGSRAVLLDQTVPFLDRLITTLNTVTDGSEQRLHQAKDEFLSAFGTTLRGDKLLSLAVRFHQRWLEFNQQRVAPLLLNLRREIVEELPLISIYDDEKMRLFFAIFPIIGTTLLSARTAFGELTTAKIEFCLIDECSQSVPAQILPLLVRSNRSLLIGDPAQASPVIKTSFEDWSELAAANGVTSELLTQEYYFPTEKNLYSSQHLADYLQLGQLALSEHYRSQPAIAKFFAELSNYKFSVHTPAIKQPHPQLASNSWWYLDSTASEERKAASWVNQQEAKLVVALLAYLKPQQAPNFTITVLTPYKAQSGYIRQLCYKQGLITNSTKAIQVSTIHGFQGAESNLVIFSATLTNQAHWFLNQRINLLNVAVSRASDYFIFVGSLKNLLAKNNNEQAAKRPTALLHRYLSAGKDIGGFLAS